MSRVLKFRAFIDNEMVYLPMAGLQYFDFEGSYALSFVVDGYSGFWGHECYEKARKKERDNAVIMQFTGITDVNGQEIYEGDCDAVGNVVEFVNGSWCLNGDRPLTSRFIKAGNKFENPELL